MSSIIERPPGLHSSTETLKLSSTFCFKYFAIINFARKVNALVIFDLLAGSFPILKLSSKAATQVVQ